MKEGETSSENWMLDEARQTVLSSLEKNLSTEELIKELAIQKIEYGRTCIAQFLAMTSLDGKTTKEEAESFYNETDGKLQQRIKELGGKPTSIQFVNKSEKH